MPDHHVLSIELLRTRGDETAAVFTIVRDGKPVQTVVMGDANGRVTVDDCGPRRWMLDLEARDAAAQAPEPSLDDEMRAVAMSMTAEVVPDAGSDDGSDDGDDDGVASPDGFAFGGPPPKQPPEPGIIAVGTVLLASAFNLAEQVPPASDS